MTITFLLPSDTLNGGIRVVASYAAELRSRNHKVQVVYRGRENSIRSIARRVAAVVRGEPRQEQSHFARHKIETICVAPGVPIHENVVPDADVIIATWWETAAWMQMYPASKGKKVYLIQHDERELDQPINKVVETWRMPTTKVVVAEWLKSLLEVNSCGISTVIENPVERELFYPVATKRPAGFRVGFTYSLRASKGTAIAIEAIESARQQSDLIEAVALGTNRATKALPLPSWVKYERNPPQESLRNIYSSCNVWLFSSISEGFGLPILEAMACGTPVIATPCGAAPELLASGGGWLLNDFSPSAMSNKLLHVAKMGEATWAGYSQRAIVESRIRSWSRATDALERAIGIRP